jgi:hypothetical protein
MEDKRKYRLKQETSQESVNEETYDKLQLKSKDNLLPVNDINRIINVSDQFNKERQNSNYYRITGSFNTLFNNTLFNTTGNNSWNSFNGDLFRDNEFPPDGIDLNADDGDYTYKESVAYHLKENNGWFGFKDPNPNNESLCIWNDMEPNRTLFSLSPKNNIKNWELTITYPVANDHSVNIINNGILIIDSTPTIIGNRNMMTFTTPVKHGLSQGEGVDLSNITDDNLFDGVYNVVRLGEDNGDNKEYYFSVEISGITSLTANARMSRVYNGRKSVYYFRRFKKINVRVDGEEMENDDYEIFPLAFSQNIYEDKVNHFVINEDIDISGLKDNWGRPLSEIFVTIIKTDSGGKFTNVKSGIDIPLISVIENNAGIPDIRRITNYVGITDDNHTTSHIPLDLDVKITDDAFYGDVAEYNIFEQKEKILADVYHRFNTSNREIGGALIDVDFSGTQITLGKRYEGYMYKPHHKIKIREYSSYIEEGTSSTLDMPSYAINTLDGRFLWRDLLDIGLNDIQETILDYPFLNGTHYINTNISLPLKRQDPFGFYGLQHKTFPADNPGILLDDTIIIKKSQDVC